MKKPLAYIALAVLLGVVVMFVPLQLLPNMRYPATGETLSVQTTDRQLKSSTLNGESTMAFQLNLLSGGSMSAFGFVFALGVFLYVRKRVV